MTGIAGRSAPLLCFEFHADDGKYSSRQPGHHFIACGLDAVESVHRPVAGEFRVPAPEHVASAGLSLVSRASQNAVPAG